MKTSTILAIIGLVMAPIGGGALWAHNHGSELPRANEDRGKQRSKLAVYHASIHVFEKEDHDLRMTIARIQNQLTQIVLSQNKNPEILELKIQLEIQLKDWKRQLEQKEKRLHDTRAEESVLIMQLSSA